MQPVEVETGAPAGGVGEENAAVQAASTMQRRLPEWAVGLAVFAVMAPLLWAFYARHPLLYDTDSSYHLAVARGLAQHGLGHQLPLRKSVITLHGTADGSLLFHLLLAPFAGQDDPVAGGRAALSLLDALLLATIASLAWRAAAWWGLLATVAIGVGSLEVGWRLVRLRPELLALPLLLLALAAAGSHRYRWLGLLAGAFALAYFAWHGFVALFLLLFIFRGWVRGRWDWPLALYPVAGTGVGLLLHPSLTATLLLWKTQVFDVFRLRNALDTGTELAPSRLDVMLLANLGFWLFAAICWRSRVPREAGATRRAAGDTVRRDLADAFGLAAVCCAALYLVMSRFAIYVFPLTGLWLLFGLAADGQTIGRRVRLPFRGAVSTALALGLAALLAVPGTMQELRRFGSRTQPGPRGERLTDRAALARAVPPGAQVASTWGDTATYLLWAPQGRYLNAADPAFLAVPYPRAYAAQRALFAGDEPDVPLAAVAELDSRYVAWSLPGAPPGLLARLENDPRARQLHRGFQALFALTPAPPGSFVLDWRVVPAGVLPAAAEVSIAPSPLYPRHPVEEARPMEGFVDAGRVGRGCVGFARDGTSGEKGWYELAAHGPTKLWIDRQLVLTTGGNGAVLGRGVGLALAAAPRISLLTCPGEGGRAGFYLLRRG